MTTSIKATALEPDPSFDARVSGLLGRIGRQAPVYGLPVLTLFGSALAFMRVRTGSVLPCMVTHALFNGFAMIVSISVE